MRNTVIFSFAAMMLFSIPFVAAHPDTVGVSINTMKEIISEDKIFGVMQDNKQDTGGEFLSLSWIYENFILLLTGMITAIVLVIFVFTYREEIGLEKNLRLESWHSVKP